MITSATNNPATSITVESFLEVAKNLSASLPENNILEVIVTKTFSLPDTVLMLKFSYGSYVLLSPEIFSNMPKTQKSEKVFLFGKIPVIENENHCEEVIASWMLEHNLKPDRFLYYVNGEDINGV